MVFDNPKFRLAQRWKEAPGGWVFICLGIGEEDGYSNLRTSDFMTGKCH